jgi:excisionase family DNA binding protein/PAS domain S-box-containing protein
MGVKKRDEHLLTLKEVAAYLKVNQTTIYRLVRRAEIPALKIGGDWRFSIDGVDAWRQRRAKLPHSRRRANSELAETELPVIPADLVRLYQTVAALIAPLTELRAVLPLIKRIAEAIDDRRDTSGLLEQLYQGEAILVRDHLKNLMEFAPIPFAVIDRDCHAVSFNDGYCQLLGLSAKQLRMTVLTDLVCAPDRDRAAAMHRQLLDNETHANVFTGRVTAAGAPILVSSHAWAVRESPYGKPEYLADVLQRVATREESLGMFARGADDLSDRREKILSGS